MTALCQSEHVGHLDGFDLDTPTPPPVSPTMSDGSPTESISARLKIPNLTKKKKKKSRLAHTRVESCVHPTSAPGIGHERPVPRPHAQLQQLIEAGIGGSNIDAKGG